MDEDEDNPITLELEQGEPIVLTEEERIEVLLDWAPMVGYA